MENLVIAALLAVLVLQFPLGIVVYFDAKRLDVDHPEHYWLGIIVPAGGLLVVLYYFSERRTKTRG